MLNYNFHLFNNKIMYLVSNAKFYLLQFLLNKFIIIFFSKHFNSTIFFTGIRVKASQIFIKILIIN